VAPVERVNQPAAKPTQHKDTHKSHKRFHSVTFAPFAPLLYRFGMAYGKVLALDWGEKRCGWALSDTGQTLSARHATYTRRTLEQDLDFFADLVKSEAVVEVALGVPYNMDGSSGPQVQAILAIKPLLEQRLGLPVYDVDERLTSAEAERALIEGGLSRKRRKGKRDALAATLILQTHLDHKRSAERR